MLAILRRIFAVAVVMTGLALTFGGAYLVYLGGSRYYLPIGLLLILSGVAIWRGDRRGACLFIAIVVATVIWSVWEVGFSFWALVPRTAMFLVMTLWLLVPWQRQGLVHHAAANPRRLGLAAVVVLVLGTTAAALARPDVPLGPDMPSGVALGARNPVASGDGSWIAFGGTGAGTRFASLNEIRPDNVNKLKVAWTYRTGDLARSQGGENVPLDLESTPLAIGNRLFTCTPSYVVDALDADTGKRIWRFDPKNNNPKAMVKTCRGVAYARVSTQAAVASDSCAERILLYTGDARLMAIDARRGTLCPGFGTRGSVDLTQGMGQIAPGSLSSTSPPEIVNGIAVIGSQVLDGGQVGEASGVIRGYDVVTGRLVWAWDMARPDRTGLPPAGETFTRGTPNAWGPLSGDPEAGLVFVPLGNETPDFYAGHHRNPASERYTDAVVALDARSGRERWHFQTTHHDTWDYDVPSQPVLIDWKVGDRMVPAVVQATKRGEFFVLDRMTGKPLMPVVERRVPTANPLPGEWLSQTQPFSNGMPELNTVRYSEAQMWGMTPLDQLECRIRFRSLRYDGQFTPQSTQGTLNDPGNAGYMDWGGVSIDLSRRLMMVNSIRLPFVLTAIPRDQAEAAKAAEQNKAAHAGGVDLQQGVPFANRTAPFLSSAHVPCVMPPWGYIQAIDLDTHQTVWKRPLGTGRDSGPFGLHFGPPVELGVFSQGGSVTTASGLTFIGSTTDRYFRAIDNRNGQELWRARLPAGGQASPMSFRSSRTGKQYVVIAAGGHGSLETKAGDHIIAYALP